MLIDKRTLIKIAHWYYELGLTQEQIAHKLKYSRQRVNKLVNSLVAEGIVTIQINGLDQQFLRLESMIEDRFALSQVLIADSDNTEAPTPFILGKKAAEFLDSYIKDNMTIGVSWGVAVGETVSSVRTTSKSGCSVVQLVGGLNTDNLMIKPDEITRILAGRLGCGFHNLYAPAIISSDEVRDVILNEESIRIVFQKIEKCNLAIIGIGQLSPQSTVAVNGYIKEDTLKGLAQEGCTGDICFNHFTIDGDWVESSRGRLIIGVDRETLSKIPNVVAVAGGVEKVDAIIGALNTGCINTLIIDSTTARMIANKLDMAI